MKFDSVTKITKAIKQHPQNKEMSEQGHLPIFSADPKSKIVIIGQAPGARAQEAEKPWADKSGEQLLRWLGITEEVFYDKTKIALMPMDFYFPGKGKTGDLPPRKGFADLWHPPLLTLMSEVQLILLIGQYAQGYYLTDKKDTLTETVRNYKQYQADKFFPLPHPSPRNNIWKKKNPWFEKNVVPELQKVIKRAFL